MFVMVMKGCRGGGGDVLLDMKCPLDSVSGRLM